MHRDTPLTPCSSCRSRALVAAVTLRLFSQVHVKHRVDNVAGVKIPKYEYIKEAGESKMDLTGLAAGGQQVSRCRDAYSKTLELLVSLASLQSAFLTLDVAIKTTNRRVNALENVVKPRVANTISYIKVPPP